MKKKRFNLRALGCSIAASALLPVISTLFFSPVSLEVVISRLIIPLCRISLFIVVGLVAGQLIEGMGWTRQVAVVARPFFRFSRLGDHCSAAFTTAFFPAPHPMPCWRNITTKEKLPGASFFYPITSISSRLFSPSSHDHVHCASTDWDRRGILFFAHFSGSAVENLPFSDVRTSLFDTTAGTGFCGHGYSKHRPA